MKIATHSLPYKPELDGMRGIAILLVLFYHIWPDSVSFGYLGVDIFFVLSGYLITKVVVTRHESGEYSLLHFYRNRVRRIFPAMWLVLFSTLLLGYITLFTDEFSRVAAHVRSSAFFFQNFQLRSEAGYWDEAAHLKPLLHFWSLSIEEQFYVFWPFVVGLAVSLRRYSLFALTTISFLGLSLFLESSGDMFFHSAARFWEMSLGGTVVWAERNSHIRGAVQRLPGIVMWLAFCVALAVGYEVHNYQSILVLPSVFVAALWLVRLHEGQDRILRNRALIFFGLISFPMYLWHYPIIAFINIFGKDSAKFGVPIVFLTTILSYLTYRYVELFFRRQTSYKYMAGLVIAVATLGSTGQYFYNNAEQIERPHLDRYAAMLTEFERTPMKDDYCNALVENLSSKPPLFNMCRATTAATDATFVVLLGDSHAQAAFHGFAEVLQDHGLETLLLASSACPMYVDGAMAYKAEDIAACQQAIDQAYAVLDNLPEVNRAILVSRGPKITTGRGFGKVDRPHFKPRYYANYFQEGNTDPGLQEGFQRMYKSTLQYLIRRQIPAYLLLENPELGFWPKSCVGRTFGLFTTQCRVAYTEYSTRMRSYRSMMKDIADGFPEVQLLDPEPLFCDSQWCHALQEGTMLYADDDHLSKSGSLLQAQGLVPQLLE